jgi:CheY-like chemotaxis protein
MMTDSSKKILVVEDDAATRDAVALVLRDGGFSVTEAANGHEALLHLRTTPPPQLILLDLMMPVMNGWEFRKQQTQDPALQSIPVVIVSADTNVPQKAAALGARDYLVKPIDLDKLLEAVQRHC